MLSPRLRGLPAGLRLSGRAYYQGGPVQDLPPLRHLGGEPPVPPPYAVQEG